MSRAGFFADNSNRAYPFLAGSVGQDLSGPVTLANLPNSAIVDCGFSFGPLHDVDPTVYSVKLNKVSRSGSVFTFEFVSTHPAVANTPLTFTRAVTDTAFITEFTDSGDLGQSLSESVSTFSGSSHIRHECREPLWEGFLVTGDLSELALLLAANGSITGGTATVEPGLVTSLYMNNVVAVDLHNNDRVRHEEPPDCPDLTWPYPIGLIYLNQRCLTGDLSFSAGYNAEVRQSDSANSITISARVGAGKGEPCAEVPLFETEIPPTAANGEQRHLLDGSFACGQTLKSINGISKSMFTFTAKRGVRIESKPETNEVIFHVDLAGTSIIIPDSADSL